jgi:ABC-type nitrate/sulfonate/bicarbonate transport system permease component
LLSVGPFWRGGVRASDESPDRAGIRNTFKIVRWGSRTPSRAARCPFSRTSARRSSLVLGFVGAGGIGFQLLTAMNLFQYREVSLLLIVIFVIVLTVERLSAFLRQRLA